MTAPIAPISVPALADTGLKTASTSGGAGGGSAFQDVFTNAIQNVEAFGADASASAQRFLAGEGEELHTTILAAQRAELTFELFLQARNKVVSAYQEIMRMQM